MIYVNLVSTNKLLNCRNSWAMTEHQMMDRVIGQAVSVLFPAVNGYKTQSSTTTEAHSSLEWNGQHRRLFPIPRYSTTGVHIFGKVFHPLFLLTSLRDLFELWKLFIRCLPEILNKLIEQGTSVNSTSGSEMSLVSMPFIKLTG